MIIAPLPIAFESRAFLEGHVRQTMAFYDPRCRDPEGGFFHSYMVNGEVFDHQRKSLVSSCRFVFNYAMAKRYFGEPAYDAYLDHGLHYLRSRHLDPDTGGYAWALDRHLPSDLAQHCYGFAFVLLAYSCSALAGHPDARVWIDETFETMERRFWLADPGIYGSEADAAWRLDAYRGQNDNMHCCEALLFAFEATGQVRFLDRACQIAEFITSRTTQLSDGQVWEHFHTDWTPDFDYARDGKATAIRPWGVLPGHQTEWAKLLLMLDRHRPEPWRLEKATKLFDRAVLNGWDHEHGGLFMSYGLDGSVHDDNKSFWVHAETIAAAALLAARTGSRLYQDWYRTLWSYSFVHLVDHAHGAWYRVLDRQGRRLDERKSYNNKTDYHTMGACYEILRELYGSPVSNRL